MTVTAFEIPLTNQGQKLSISLAGVVYQLQVVWNQYIPSWVMDVSDASGNLIVGGVPLITGADLLEQYGYMGLAGGGMLLVQSDSTPLEVPDYSSLGSTGHLYFVQQS